MNSLEKIRAKYAYEAVASLASTATINTQEADSAPTSPASPAKTPTSLRGGTKERYIVTTRAHGRIFPSNVPKYWHYKEVERRLFNATDCDESCRTAWGLTGRAKRRAYARFPFGVASVVLFVADNGTFNGWALEDTQALWEAIDSAAE